MGGHQFWWGVGVSKKIVRWGVPAPPTLWETLYSSSHREARKINCGKLVNLIQRVRLGTLPQEVMMALSHNYVTNLFISSYRGASV